MSVRRNVVIGLDGATFDVMDPLVKAGRLPTLAQLMSQGVRGRLLSTVPPATVPAWPTFMTGKSPGLHGVFDFFKRLETGERRLVSARDIDGPTLWRFLSDMGCRCIVLNVPCTFPPEPINGVLVSGMLTPAGEGYVSPPGMADQLDAWTGGYRVNLRAKYEGNPVDRDGLIRELREISDIQTRAFVKLLETEPWDLAMLMYRATDIIQHKLWHQPEDIAWMYQFLDGAVAQILSLAKDATIWLMSDHGFGPQTKAFHVNQWLRDQGWLAIRHKEATAHSGVVRPVREGQSVLGSWLKGRLARMGISRDRARALLPPKMLPLAERLLPAGLRRWVPQSSYAVDWANTRVVSDSAFTLETQALRINVRGRDPWGIVDPGRYDSFRREVIQALRSLRDPETGQTVVTDVHKGDELFAGPYAHDAPDLILQLRDGYKMTGNFVAREYVSSLSPIRGCHRRDGVFVVAGPEIAGCRDLGTLGIIDVMPTLLHGMGVAVPAGCDGRVRLDVFAPSAEPVSRPVCYVDVDPSAPPPAEAAGGDNDVLDRLRGLGYVE